MDLKKQILKFFIPIFGIFIFTAKIIFLLKAGFANLVLADKVFGILSIFSTISCIFLLIYPDKTIIYAITATIFTVSLTFTAKNELDLYLSFVVTVVAFWNQGFYSYNNKIKHILTNSGLFLILIIRLIILKEEFFIRLWNLCPIFFLASILYLFVLNSFRFNQFKNAKLIVNLDEYNHLTERQVLLIRSILENEKYDDFANRYNISVSTVKRDAVMIFKLFNSSNRLSFTSKFSSYEFYYKNQLIYKSQNKYPESN